VKLLFLSGVTAVTNLEPEECTGLVCSPRLIWGEPVTWAVAVTGGYAGTVVTNDSTFIDLTTSAVRGTSDGQSIIQKQYDVSITRTTEDDDDRKNN